MAATARFLRASKNTTAPKSSRLARPSMPCITAELGGEWRVHFKDNRPAVAVKAAVADPGLNFVANQIATKAIKLLNPKPISWDVLQLQIILEKAIIDCRFFTMFAVLGSLLGSILCFIEGCVIIVRSYVHYCSGMVSHNSDPSHVVHLLIEAIDMFLVGTAMLVFGMGLYVTYVGTKSIHGKESWLPTSNFFGLFYFKTVPSWIEEQSVSEAKSKIGHAMMMIVQVGVVDKFKSVPLVTALDLACFAGALLFSAAAIFLLSKTTP